MDKASIYLLRSCAEAYDKDRYDGAFGRSLKDREVETFLSMMDSSGRILDVGAGTGKLSLPLLAASRHVVSLDASPEMLRVARQTGRKAGVDLRPIGGDAARLCFRENAFPCVVSSRVLTHLPDWKRALSEACRVAQFVVVVDFPPWVSFAGLASFFRKLVSFFSSDIQPCGAFFVTTVRREFHSHGFQVVEEKRAYFLPIAFHRWLDKPKLTSKVETIFARLGLTRVFGAPATLRAAKNRARTKS